MKSLKWKHELLDRLSGSRNYWIAQVVAGFIGIAIVVAGVIGIAQVVARVIGIAQVVAGVIGIV